jgi:hypothetical protein
MSLESMFWGDLSRGFWGRVSGFPGSSRGVKRSEIECAAKAVMTRN